MQATTNWIFRTVLFLCFVVSSPLLFAGGIKGDLSFLIWIPVVFLLLEFLVIFSIIRAYHYKNGVTVRRSIGTSVLVWLMSIVFWIVIFVAGCQ